MKKRTVDNGGDVDTGILDDDSVAWQSLGDPEFRRACMDAKCENDTVFN